MKRIQKLLAEGLSIVVDLVLRNGTMQGLASIAVALILLNLFGGEDRTGHSLFESVVVILLMMILVKLFEIEAELRKK